jgi:hypothetical protein
MDDVDGIDQIMEVFGDKLIEYGLGDEHIIKISLEHLVEEDTVLILLEMKQTGWQMLSTYIGITYNKSFGFEVFTLEKSGGFSGVEIYMLCYVEFDSENEFDRGSIHTVPNDREAFILAVRSLMTDIPQNDDIPIILNVEADKIVVSNTSDVKFTIETNNVVQKVVLQRAATGALLAVLYESKATSRDTKEWTFDWNAIYSGLDFTTMDISTFPIEVLAFDDVTESGEYDEMIFAISITSFDVNF